MCMDNFVLGLQAIYSGAILTIRQITQYQLFWGFASGFFVSTIVHGFLITENPKHIPTMLFEDKAVSFQKINARTEDQPYNASFFLFSKNVDKIKLTFGIGAILLFTLFIIALISF
jgi:hypothetical protein